MATEKLLDRPAKKASKTEQKSYLEHLNKLAAAGGHGVNLAKMSLNEIRSRLFGD